MSLDSNSRCHVTKDKTNLTKTGILRCWSAGRLKDAAFGTALMSLMFHSVKQDRTVSIHLEDFPHLVGDR